MYFNCDINPELSFFLNFFTLLIFCIVFHILNLQYPEVISALSHDKLKQLVWAEMRRGRLWGLLLIFLPASAENRYHHEDDGGTEESGPTKNLRYRAWNR